MGAMSFVNVTGWLFPVGAICPAEGNVVSASTTTTANPNDEAHCQREINLMVFTPQRSTRSSAGCARRRQHPYLPRTAGLAQALMHFHPAPRQRVNTMILVAPSGAQMDTLNSDS